MVVHDWRKLNEGDWHSFYFCWLASLYSALNRYALPKALYGHFEFKDAVRKRNKLLPGQWAPPSRSDLGTPAQDIVAASEDENEHFFYRSKQRFLFVCRAEDASRVSVIDIVSPWNLECEIEADTVEGLPLFQIDLAIRGIGSPISDREMVLPYGTSFRVPLFESYEHAWHGTPKFQRQILASDEVEGGGP